MKNNIRILLFFPMFFLMACSTTTWIVESQEEVDRGDYKLLNSKLFLQKVGIDAEKRVILLTPVGDKFGNTDAQIFDILCEAIRDKELPSDVEILVRVPPGDTVSLENFKACKEIHIDYPGTEFNTYSRKANEMSYRDLLHLADSLYHSELVISSPSTMVIDGAAFDKPLILLGFEGREHKDYFDSFVHIYDYDHMQHVIKTGGTRMAKSPDELIDAINHYLNYPEEGENERKKIVDEQCVYTDGKSGERIARVLLSFV